MPEIEVVNRQKKIEINPNEWIDFCRAALSKIVQAENKSFTVAFVSDRRMRELNHDFRGKKTTTDVLSFPFNEEDSSELDGDLDDFYLGDIVVSVEQAARQSAENNLELEMEIKQLIVHGILHLCGFDHETDDGEMNRLELKYRRQLKINF